MCSGPQLPLEILPLILENLEWRTRDLYTCCLVSRTFNHYATPRLYARLFLRDQQRLIKVFQLLQDNEFLAKLVRVLEIRVYPFGLKAEDLERVEASLLASLLNATNLTELYWTRTGSLTDRIIPFLPALTSLQTLELTGSSRFYSPENITRYLIASDKTPNLRHFSILLPDRRVTEELPRWAQQMGNKLQSFSILCQHSPVVADSTLQVLSQYLTGLTRLSIAGAKRITADGVIPMLKSGKMNELALEGLALHPNSFSRMTSLLANLKALSLTFPKQALCPAQDFWQYLASFVEDLPNLTEFTHYRSSWNTFQLDQEQVDGGEDALDDLADAHNSQNPQEYRRQELEEHAASGQPIIREPRLSTSFLKRLVSARGSNMTKLRIHGIVSTMEQVRLICQSCPRLQHLVVQLFEDEKPALESSLVLLPQLVSLHILSPLYSALFLNEDDLQRIALKCSTTLRQIGFRNRVWLIDRQHSPHTFEDKTSTLPLVETSLAAQPFLRSLTTAP